MVNRTGFLGRFLELVIFVQLGALLQFVHGQTCTSGQYYNNQTSACSSCPTGCSACTSSTSCSGCLDRYYLNSSNTTSNTTINVTNNTSRPGPIFSKLPDIRTNTTCQPCSTNCLKCSASNCTLCADRFFLDSVRCSDCPVSCEVCTAKNSCDRCIAEHVWDAASVSCVPGQNASVVRRSSAAATTLSTAAIVGISTGSVGGLGLGGFGIYCLIKYFKSKSSLTSSKTTDASPPITKLTMQLEPEPELDQKPDNPDQVLDPALVTIAPQTAPNVVESAPQSADFEDVIPEVRPEVHRQHTQGELDQNPPSTSAVARGGHL